jgi:chorismate mutase
MTPEDIEFKKDTLNEYTDNMHAFLDTNDNEISEHIVEYIENWMAIQQEFKDLKKKEASMKEQASKNGVPVSRVMAVIDKMKKKINQNPSDKEEEEEIYNLLLERSMANNIKAMVKN